MSDRGLSDLRDLAPGPQPPPVGPLPRPAPRLPKPLKPLPKVNRERKAIRMALQFGPQARAARLMPCCVCGRKPSDPAHVLSRGAGGKDSDVVPLCSGPRGHHAEQHRSGIETFQAKHNIALDVVAAELAQAVKQHECSAWVVYDAKGGASCAICQGPVDEDEVTP